MYTDLKTVKTLTTHSSSPVELVNTLITDIIDVIVPTMKDATNVLESCQRSRMGKKRILVTLTQSSDIRYPYYFIFAYFLYCVRRMNTFRANISFLMKDGYSMSLSDLQVGFELIFY